MSHQNISQFQIQNTRRDIATRQSTLQQLQSDYDHVQRQHQDLFNNHKSRNDNNDNNHNTCTSSIFALCQGLEESCRRQITDSQQEYFSTLHSLVVGMTGGRHGRIESAASSSSSSPTRSTSTPSSPSRVKLSKPSSTGQNNNNNPRIAGDKLTTSGSLWTRGGKNTASQPPPQQQQQQSPSEKPLKKIGDDLNDLDHYSSSSGSEDDDDEDDVVDGNREGSSKVLDRNRKTADDAGDASKLEQQRRLLRRDSSIRLRDYFGEALIGHSVPTSAFTPEELMSSKTAKAIAAARTQQLQEEVMMSEETLRANGGGGPPPPGIPPLVGGNNNNNSNMNNTNNNSPNRKNNTSDTNNNNSASKDPIPPSASSSLTGNPILDAFAAIFGVGTNNDNANNNSTTSTNGTGANNNNNNNALNNSSSTAAARSKNINLSYDEEILKSSVLQKQFQDQNPNQLGDLLLDPYHPMWYTGKCLSAVLRTYYGGHVNPELVEISNSHEEQNVAAMASSVMNTAVSTAETVVGTATSLFGALIAKTTDFVKQIGGDSSNNNSNKNTQSNNNSNSPSSSSSRPFFGNGGQNEQKSSYIVEPVWLHMENNDIVVNTVQPSLFLPFPSFNEHNDDEKLRALYREMSRRAAAERSRREGTTAAIAIHNQRGDQDVTATGGFVANDTRRIYNNKSIISSTTTAASTSTSTTTSSQQQQGHGHENFNNLIRSQPRHIRADEFRVAFFATDVFRRIHQALDFDTNDLVEHAIFDLAHPWRVAHSPGKSDSSFFFFGHFVAKSLKEHEFKFFFDKFLAKYVDHVEMNKFTLLPHFLGLLSIADLSRGTSSPQIMRIVIMKNVFPTRRVIHRMYDLKGSTINRDGLSGDITRTSFGAVLLKDNDLPKKLLLVGPVRGKLLNTQLRCDTDFLNSLSIIDYSLLVGVRSEYLPVGPKGVEFNSKYNNQNKHTNGSHHQHHTSHDSPTSNSHKHNEQDGECFRSWDGGMPSLPIFDNPSDMTMARIDTFYIGLIDVLQNFSAAKRFEATTKGFLYNGQASVVPPQEFAMRICESIERITE